MLAFPDVARSGPAHAYGAFRAANSANPFIESAGPIGEMSRGGQELAMAMQWILTWARTAFISISRKNVPPRLEHAAFDSQTEAVNFAMSLDHPQRRTVRLLLPGRAIA